MTANFCAGFNLRSVISFAHSTPLSLSVYIFKTFVVVVCFRERDGRREGEREGGRGGGGERERERETHTHTHTHTDRQRQRQRDTERDRESD